MDLIGISTIPNIAQHNKIVIVAHKYNVCVTVLFISIYSLILLRLSMGDTIFCFIHKSQFATDS